jgi:hypothetical protein
MKKPKFAIRNWLGAAACTIALGIPSAGLAQAAPTLSAGQTLYLPIYSHLYHGDLDSSGKPAEELLSAHVSIRNTDTKGILKVTSARYFDTDGKMLKEYVPTPRPVVPMGTLELFVPYRDVSGGSGANFVITWSADAAINPPVVEAVHAEVRASRGLVFVTSARPILPR